MQILTANTPYGTYRYPATDSIGQKIASNVFWDDHLRSAIDRVEPGRVMVDAGANLGFFSIYLARKGVKVHAFEPCNGVFELLAENVALNGVQDLVTLHKTALYSVDGPLHKNTQCGWTYPATSSGELDFDHIVNTGQLALMPGSGGIYSMEGRTLDSFHLEDVALIKSDVQGCDLQMLKGARETIERCKPIICFEFERVPSAVHGDTKATYEAFVEEIGYRIESAFNPDPSRHDDYSDYVVVPK